MFEVKILVDNNKLDKVLWALDGLVVGMPQILPVRTEPKNATAETTKAPWDKAAPTVKRPYHRTKSGAKRKPIARKRGVMGQPKLPFTQTVPGRCAVVWKTRGVTSVDHAEILATLEAIGANAGSVYYVKVYLEQNGVFGPKQASDGKFPIKYGTLNLLIEQSKEEIEARAEKGNG